MKNEPEAVQVEPGSLTVIVPVEFALAPAKPRTLVSVPPLRTSSVPVPLWPTET